MIVPKIMHTVTEKDWHSRHRGELAIPIRAASFLLAPMPLLLYWMALIFTNISEYIPDLVRTFLGVFALHYQLSLHRTANKHLSMDKMLMEYVTQGMKEATTYQDTANVAMWWSIMEKSMRSVLFHKRFIRVLFFRPVLDSYPVPVQTFFDWLPVSNKAEK